MKTTDESEGHDWAAELEKRWQALGRKVFVRRPKRPPRLQEMLDECAVLAVVWGMVERKGCLTNAAGWLDCSRRRVRGHVRAWFQANPDLIPMPFQIYMHWTQGKGETA